MLNYYKIQACETEMLILYPVYEKQTSHPLHQKCRESQMYWKKNPKKKRKDLQQILLS